MRARTNAGNAGNGKQRIGDSGGFETKTQTEMSTALATGSAVHFQADVKGFDSSQWDVVDMLNLGGVVAGYSGQLYSMTLASDMQGGDFLDRVDTSKARAGIS